MQHVFAFFDATVRKEIQRRWAIIASLPPRSFFALVYTSSLAAQYELPTQRAEAEETGRHLHSDVGHWLENDHSTRLRTSEDTLHDSQGVQNLRDTAREPHATKMVRSDHSTHKYQAGREA